MGATTQPTSRRRRGYTMIELVVVMIVMALLCAIAGPRYANSAALYRGQMAAQRIAADISLAQRTAKTTSLGQTINFTLATSSYAIAGIAGLSGSGATYNVNLVADPYQASLVSVTLGAGTSITFDRFGQPSSGGTIILQSGNSTRTITIDPTSGIATIQ